ncbi:MAG: PEP-CTERM sorting domain-containing protein [Casimicrobiaceae bacterium]
MSKRTRCNVVASVAASAMLLFGGTASGAFYSSSFDPPGPLNFGGTALFQLDDSCLTDDGFYTAGACHLTLVHATVDMIDTASHDTGHLDFVNVLPDTFDMVDLYISGGNLIGVDTGWVGWTLTSPCSGTLCGIPWWIRWQSGLPDPVYLYTGTCSTVSHCTPNHDPAGIAPNVTFTRVPEPGTLALVIAALGAGWLVRRRRLH